MTYGSGARIGPGSAETRRIIQSELTDNHAERHPMKTSTLILAALVAVAVPVEAQQRIDERFPADAAGSVEVANISGSISVTTWDRNEIEVTGTLGRGTERLALERDRRNARIRVVIPSNARNVQGTDLRIRVPAGKNVSIRGVSAGVTVDGVQGDVDARSTSGNVTVTGAPANVRAGSTSGDVTLSVNTRGQVTASSTSGSVEVSGNAGNGVSAESVSGNVDVTAVTPEVRASSVSGSVSVQGGAERISASTVSGRARVADARARYTSMESVSGSLVYIGELPRGAAFDLKSHSGDIELVLPRDARLDLDARTFSGRITSEFGGEARRTSQYGPGRELRYSTGDGGGLVRAQTFSGSVKLRRQ